MNRLLMIAVTAVALLGLGVAAQASLITIDTVPVGNPGNAPDTWGAGYGAVDYGYEIGKYQVTAGQYTAFLNAVAATDTYGLYNEEMWNHLRGCKIQRHGTSGSYTYIVDPGYANRPVNFVSWGDAARFANWLHNDQPTGLQDLTTTEDGAYTLDGATTNEKLMAITRNAGWKWAITSEDEWYKAAYHKNDGTDDYWLYPTSSDEIDTTMANYGGSVTSPTDVGSYPYPSPYGTYDQGGNVWEWNEAVISPTLRCMRGGSFGTPGEHLGATVRNWYDPSDVNAHIGFRVVVPEPGSALLLLIGCAGLVSRRRRI